MSKYHIVGNLMSRLKFFVRFSVQDAYVKELEQNMTYYKNAYVSSEKALTNIRALESFLQAQVKVNDVRTCGLLNIY